MDGLYGASFMNGRVGMASDADTSAADAERGSASPSSVITLDSSILTLSK